MTTNLVFPKISSHSSLFENVLKKNKCIVKLTSLQRDNYCATVKFSLGSDRRYHYCA
ncbi:MAG: hypothetical protein WBM62_12270 [Crocosphaera sp.]